MSRNGFVNLFTLLFSISSYAMQYTKFKNTLLLYVSDTLALFFYLVHFSTPTFSRDTNKTYFLENIEAEIVDIICN